MMQMQLQVLHVCLPFSNFQRRLLRFRAALESTSGRVSMGHLQEGLGGPLAGLRAIFSGAPAVSATNGRVTPAAAMADTFIMVSPNQAVDP